MIYFARINLQYGSASFMYATATLVLPLGTILFSSPIMAAHQQKFSTLSAIGLAVVLFGTKSR